MSQDSYWLQFNNGNKEQLKNLKQGVRKEQLDKKYDKLFNIFDVNKDGSLEKEEVSGLLSWLKAGAEIDSDKTTLSLLENILLSHKFSQQFVEELGEDADINFAEFAQAINEAAEQIESMTETIQGYPPESGLETGERIIKTKYKGGTFVEIHLYPNGEFKKKITTKPLVKNEVFYSINGSDKTISAKELENVIKGEYQKKYAKYISQERKQILIPSYQEFKKEFIQLYNVQKHSTDIRTEYSDRYKREEFAIDLSKQLYSALTEDDVNQEKLTAILNQVTPNNVTEVLFAFRKTFSEESLLSQITDKLSDKASEEVIVANILAKLLTRCESAGLRKDTIEEFKTSFMQEFNNTQGVLISSNTDRLDGILLAIENSIKLYEENPEIKEIVNSNSYKEQTYYKQAQQKAIVHYNYELVKQARELLESHLEYMKENLFKSLGEIAIEDIRFYIMENPVLRQFNSVANLLANAAGFDIDAFTKSIYTKIDELKELEDNLVKLENSNLNDDDFKTKYKELMGVEYTSESINALTSFSQNPPWKNDPAYTEYKNEVYKLAKEYRQGKYTLQEYLDKFKSIPAYKPDTKSKEYEQYSKQLESLMLNISGKNFTDNVVNYITTSGTLGSVVEMAAFIAVTMGMGTTAVGASWLQRAWAGAKVFGGYSVARGALNFTDDFLKGTSVSDAIGWTDTKSFEEYLGDRQNITFGGVMIGENNAEYFRKSMSVIKDWVIGKISTEQAKAQFKDIQGFTFDEFVTSTGGQLAINTSTSAIFGAVMGATAPTIEKIAKYGTQLGQKIGLEIPQLNEVAVELLEKNANGMPVVEFLTQTAIKTNSNTIAGITAKFVAETALFYGTNLSLSVIQEYFSESNTELEDAWSKGVEEFTKYLLTRLGKEAVNLLQVKSIGMIVAMMMGMNQASMVREQFSEYETMNNLTIKLEDVNGIDGIPNGTKCIVVEGPAGKIYVEGTLAKFYGKNGGYICEQNIGGQEIDAVANVMSLLDYYMAYNDIIVSGSYKPRDTTYKPNDNADGIKEGVNPAPKSQEDVHSLIETKQQMPESSETRLSPTVATSGASGKQANFGDESSTLQTSSMPSSADNQNGNSSLAQASAQNQTQKPVFELTENVDVSSVISTESVGRRMVDPSKFECSEDGVRQILEEFNKIYAEHTQGLLTKYYSETEVNSILALFAKNPEFVMNLLKEQLQVEIGNPVADYMLSPEQIDVLMQMKEEYPDIYDKLPIRDDKTGEIRYGISDFSSTQSFFRAYKKNPELTMELVNQRYLCGDRTKLRFFKFEELEEAVNDISRNPALKEALEAKVIDTKGKENFAYSYKQIKFGLLDSRAVPKEKALMQIKTQDGKYQLFSQDDVEMLVRRDVDDFLKDLNDPNKAENAKKELMIMLADSKFYEATGNRLDAIFHGESRDFIRKSIPDGAYAVDIGELYVDGTYEIRALTKDGVQTTRFRYNPASFNTVEIIANEEVILQDEHSTTVKTEFVDGRVIVDKFEKDTYEAYGKPRSFIISQTRIEYDRDGEPVYEEVITPSKTVAGEMDVTRADRVNGRVAVAETKMFGKTVPLTQSHKKVHSQNNVTTETFVTQEEGCIKSSYVIKDADGKVILNQERQHFQIDENNFISIVNGQKYDIKFEGNKIVVTKEGTNGEPSETITLDSEMVDPRLMPLFKQLPGDFMFVLKNAGISSVNLSTSPTTSNGAYFNPDTKGIVVSPELMNDPFVFAHELGHAIDALLLGNLSKDEQLRKIFDKELAAYRSHVSDAEGRITDYFSTKIHYSGNNLMEVVAEVNAIISGYRTNSSLYMRGLKLMQNFPETVKYIADKLQPTLDGKAQARTDGETQTSSHLGINGSLVGNVNYTILEEIEIETENLKTREDAEILRERLTEHRAALSEEQYKAFEDKINNFIGNFPQNVALTKGKGLVVEAWEQRSARMEEERNTRIAALDKMMVFVYSPLGNRLDRMIDTLDIRNEADVKRFKELLATDALKDFEREYLQTLLDNRLNPPTIDNYQPEQIAAEAQHLVRHFEIAADGTTDAKEKTTSGIKYQTYKAGLTDLGTVSQRVKSDTSTYDKLFNYMKDHSGATIMDALKDVRDEFGSRSIIEAGDYSDKPNVKLWLDAAKEDGLTPEERRTRLIQAAREAAIYQSEELFITLQNQMIQQAQNPNGLKGVRIVNYASADGIPMFSETQLWELYRLAEELGIEKDHIQLIELKEVLYPNGEIRVQAKDIFTKEVMDGGEYTTHSQKSGYTALQMNFETKDGDWFEFQCRDVYTDEFAEAEHLIYDTITGKDIIGRTSDLKPLYDQLLEILDETNLDKEVCKKYRTEYLNDYYTYCRGKSVGIDLEEPQLQDYAKRFGEELGIPDLKLDPRLDAKNLMALNGIASAVKDGKIGKYEAVTLYQKQVLLSRGEASQEVVKNEIDEFISRINEFAKTSYDESDFKDCSQQDLLAKITMFEFLKNEFSELSFEDGKDGLAHCVVHQITEEKLASTMEMYNYLKENKLLGKKSSDYLSTAMWVKPESVQAAKEFLETVKKDSQFMQLEPLEIEFLIQDVSPDIIRHRIEVYDILHRLTDVYSCDMYPILDQIDVSYKPIMEVYYKVWNDKNLNQTERERFFKALPFARIDSKLIADNYDYLIQIKDADAHSLVNIAYALNYSHPDYKQTVIENYKSGNYSLANISYLVYINSAERKYSPSTKIGDLENQKFISYMVDKLKKIGFTNEEIKKCSVETLNVIRKYIDYCERAGKQITEDDKQILINNNLEKRTAILNIMEFDCIGRLVLCSDEEFDSLSDKIMHSRPLCYKLKLISIEVIDRLLNMPYESYEKISNIYYGAERSFSTTLFEILTTLSEKALDNAQKRWDYLRFDKLNADQLKMLLELSDEEFNKKVVRLADRQEGTDVDPEAYRAELRAKLDGSYQLDISAYNESIAKRAADRAKKDERKTVVSFDRSTAIVPSSREAASTQLPESEQLIKELKKNGEVSLSIPVQGELHPKGDETNGRIEESRQLGEFSTGITLHYGEGRNWENSRFARDMLQNFYDGNGNTLEGIDIQIKFENGKYKVKISGKGIYDYKQVFKLGKNEHTSKDAGKYGEGLKVMFATLLDSRGATYVRHSSGDWVINLTAEQGAESSSRTRVFGDLQRAESRQEGATVEFDTTDADLVNEILKAKDYFYSPYNPDFQNLDYENEYFGIKLLPKGEKGNIYVVQRYEVDGDSPSGLDETIDGAILIFKVMPDNPEIANQLHNSYSKFMLETGRNRIPLTDLEIYSLVRRYAMTIPEKDLIRIIGSMKDTYLYKKGQKEDLSNKILDALCLAAHLREIKIDFGNDKYVVANRYTTSEDIKFAETMGKIVVVEAMEKVGVPTIYQYLSDSKKDVLPKSQLTEVQANKIKIIDEAVKLFMENLDIENMDLVTSQEASNPRYVYDKPDRDKGSNEAAEAIVKDGKSLGMWVDSKYLDKYSDIFQYVATWLHEISHKVGDDGDKVFNDRLQRVIQTISVMCENNPAFRTKLRVLNEEFKKLNESYLGSKVGYLLGKGSQTERPEEFDSEDFKAQMEQHLRWLTEDPEIPQTGEGYKPTLLDYLANQADRVDRKLYEYQKKFAYWIVGISEKLSKATENWAKDELPVHIYVSDRKTAPIQEIRVEQGNKTNRKEFEFNLIQEEPQSTKTHWTDKQHDTAELQAIKEDGGRVIEMPPLTDRQPKIEFSGIRDIDRARFEAGVAEESQMTLNYNSSNAWTLPQIARDMLQNLYDGHRGTLDGVKFDIQFDGTKYKIRISGQSEYDYFHIENIGASGEESLNDGTRGGGFGEGAKMVPLHLLHGKYVDKFTYASGDWSIDFTRQVDSEGNELPLDKGYMMTTPHVNPERVSGNYVEFETTDAHLVQAILVARDYFYHSENPDFKNFDIETPDMGIKILPSNENGNLYYNQRYGVKSEHGTSRTKFDDTVSGLHIVFKRTLTKDELAQVSMSKDCDRLGLSKNDVNKIAHKLSESMSNEQLMDAITRLQRYWMGNRAPVRYESETFEQYFVHGLIGEAMSRGLTFKDIGDLKIACVDSINYDDEKAEELVRRGYLIADNIMLYLGFPMVNEIFDSATVIQPYGASELTLPEQQKVLLLEEALGISKTDAQNGFQASIQIFDASMYQKNVEFYTRDVEGFELSLPYLAIDREFLRDNDFQTCYNALISQLRRAKSDSEARFGYRLTDLIRYQLRELSLPQNAKRLKLIEERYKAIPEEKVESAKKVDNNNNRTRADKSSDASLSDATRTHMIIPKEPEKVFLQNNPKKENCAAKMHEFFTTQSSDEILSNTRISFAQYKKEGIPLKYSREDFIKDLQKLLSDLPESERAEIKRKFNIKFVETTTSSSGIELSDIIILPKEAVTKTEQDIINLVRKFTVENEVQIADKEVKELLEAIIAEFPEFGLTIGKKQHDTHIYSVDIHTLKNLQDNIANPKYKQLDEESKLVLKYATILHDIGKRFLGYNTPDTSHEKLSAEYAKQILERFNLSDDIKNRIIKQVEHHNWLAAFNNSKHSPKAVENVIQTFGSNQDIIIAEIMAKSDYMNISNSFHLEKSRNGLSDDNILMTPVEFEEFISKAFGKIIDYKSNTADNSKNTRTVVSDIEANKIEVTALSETEVQSRKEITDNCCKKVFKYVVEEDINAEVLKNTLDKLAQNPMINSECLKELCNKISYIAEYSDQIYDYVLFDSLVNFIDNTAGQAKLQDYASSVYYCKLLEQVIEIEAFLPESSNKYIQALFKFSNENLNNINGVTYSQLWEQWIETIMKGEDENNESIGIQKIINSLNMIKENVDSKYYEEACLLLFLQNKSIDDISIYYQKISDADKIYDYLKLNLDTAGKLKFRQNFVDVIPILLERGHSHTDIANIIKSKPNLFINRELPHMDARDLADIMEEIDIINVAELEQYAEDENNARVYDLEFLYKTRIKHSMQGLYRGEGIDVLNTYRLNDGTLLGDAIIKAHEAIQKNNDFSLLDKIRDEMIGSKILHDRQMSTSSSKSTALSFAEKYDGFLWKIDSYENAPGVNMDLFNYNMENEYLFAPGVKLVITDIGFDELTGRVIISSQMVP